MNTLHQEFELVELSQSKTIIDFDCGNEDLNEFFLHDALNYSLQLLGKIYFFVRVVDQKIAASFTLANDSVKTSDLPNNRKKKLREAIPRQKHSRSFPSTLIGRLGVSLDFARQGLGTQMLEFVKTMCLIEPGSRCRFLTVDAYNQPEVLRFYESNEFKFLFSSEEQEMEYFRLDSMQLLRTRFMYFDLLDWKKFEP